MKMQLNFTYNLFYKIVPINWYNQMTEVIVEKKIVLFATKVIITTDRYIYMDELKFRKKF